MPYGPGSEHEAAFARLLRVQRAKRGLRQQDVADASGVSLHTIMRWETGQSRSHQPAQVRAVCRALGINPLEVAVALGYLSEDEIRSRTDLAWPPTATKVEYYHASGQEGDAYQSLVRRRLADALGIEKPPTLTPEEQQKLREAEDRAERDADQIYGDHAGQAVA
ncbi:helix-turn-helix domain-containing protein [Salinispora arenicola]|uniref:helix-turn-helix domain-containing protein n=1 Tax=Salinispora arenicola TaxID=168697 RepID=UPI0016B4F35D|nr:helix-turn-helix transcriptional regulator [Salinispora arenicola]NIL57119.1 helix-turn-helix domain-containing protein [Salinispora arenicola]NIL62659.1 helix-turn-helix domain-containing protein [Salinispora arenicola]